MPIARIKDKFKMRNYPQHSETKLNYLTKETPDSLEVKDYSFLKC